MRTKGRRGFSFELRILCFESERERERGLLHVGIDDVAAGVKIAAQNTVDRLLSFRCPTDS